jgi:beta-phosphoglucomutase-like phosphatase (HAD superfamily)
MPAPEGESVAGAVLIQLRSGLAGLAVGSSSQELRLFHVPNALRIARPVRERIFGSDEGTQKPN